MTISRISQERFTTFSTPTKEPMADSIGTEIAWFSSADNAVIGTVIRDKFDEDFVYVILGMEEDGIHRFMDIKASIPTQVEAENGLQSALSLIVEQNKMEEVLFQSDNLASGSPILISDINDEIKKYLKQHPERLYQVDPRKFEILIASIMADMGFDPVLTQASRDGGRDIMVKIKTELTEVLAYIECKRYSAENKVGVGVIRQVVGVHTFHKPAKSIIVTTSFYTKDAVAEAKKLENQLDLKDFNDIKEWLKEY